MPKKLTQEQLSKLRGDYMAKREALLQKKVSGLAVKLFDKVFNKYLLELEKSDGRIMASDSNISLVKGLDAIYDNFIRTYNIPVVRVFVSDVQALVPLNERYFKGLTDKDIVARTEKIKSIVDRRLGVENGKPVKGGFTEKFINDKTVLRKIKKVTMQAITKKSGFQEFRVELKKAIQGVPGEKLSGGLQQYYRNYAYSVYSQVDNLVAEKYALDLGLRYWYWTGGIIPTSREICRRCNGKIIDSQKVESLTYGELKDICKPGLNEDWQMNRDLGQLQNGCRHRKNYILDSVANKRRGDWLELSTILK